jgi:penicillin-binding protein 1C
MSWLHRGEPSQPPSPPAGVVAARVSFAAESESDRVEWFLDGTEPVGGEAELARAPGIVAPANGTIVAVDPDIAADRQRVRFSARALGAGARWRLDGADVAPVDTGYLWNPSPGAHVLQLVDAGGRSVDQVRFQVRGVATTATEENDGELANRR